ncbi:hypothetical protein BC936DRAFT_143417, partial [Jimgerdemannia flammicorona]
MTVLEGLQYDNGSKCVKIPFIGVEVSAEVIDTVARVNLIQCYRNDNNFTVNAIYKFPLPPSAAVNDFQILWDDGTKIVAKVEKKKIASGIYNSAVQSGFSAYLLEEKTPEVFEIKVGNLQSMQTITVHIGYVQELTNDLKMDNLVRFELPLTIAPRYTPPGIPFKATHVSYSQDAYAYTLEITVSCRMSGRVTNITSDSHAITTEFNIDNDGNVARVRLTNSDEVLDKDFVMLIESEGSDNPRAFVEYNPETDTNCVMLTMVPRFSFERHYRTELIFIVDCSGSMNGIKIENTKAALDLFIRSIPNETYFNIILFGTGYVTLFDKSRCNSQGILDKALKFVDNLSANMGGTQIYSPLRWAFDHAQKDMSTTIILMTDGEVNNTEELIKLTDTEIRKCKNPKYGVRVYTLGLGNSVSHHLVDGIARVGQGFAQYIGDCDMFNGKVVQILKNAVQPPITNYIVKWTPDAEHSISAERDTRKPTNIKKLSFFTPAQHINTDELHTTNIASNRQQSPNVIPVITPHSRLAVFCFLAPGQVPRKTIRLTGDSVEGLITIDVKFERLGNGTLVHTLAARRMIEEIEHGTSYLD